MIYRYTEINIKYAFREKHLQVILVIRYPGLLDEDPFGPFTRIFPADIYTYTYIYVCVYIYIYTHMYI